MRLFLLLFTCVAAAACGPPRLDATSDETMRESVARVRESLSEGQRKEFDEAFLVVGMHALPPHRTIAGTITPESIAVDAKDRLAGKTADDVIAEAARIRGDVEARAREAETRARHAQARARERAVEEARLEVARLEARRTAVETARRELSRFEVLEARFNHVITREGPEPLIVLTVRNGTEVPVSSAFFVGTLISPGRSTPWLTEEFNYSIPGGLEPGERATWQLAPDDPFSAWRTIRPEKDALLQVQVIALHGPEGQRLFTDQEFDQEDAVRLSSLKSKYGL